MKTISSTTLAKFLALILVVAYPLTACSDSKKGGVKEKVFKILNKGILKEAGKVSTIILLDDNNELVYVLSRTGKKAGKGTLGKLLKNDEKLVSSKTLNILETKGSHHFYYCDAGGDCMKFDMPH